MRTMNVVLGTLESRGLNFGCYSKLEFGIMRSHPHDCFLHMLQTCQMFVTVTSPTLKCIQDAHLIGTTCN